MRPDRNTLAVLAAVVICTLPHFPNVELWVVLACFLLWTYIVMTVSKGWSQPGRITRLTVTLILAVLSMVTHEGLTVEAFVSLLALMSSLKLLENHAARDQMNSVILCYFLIVGSLFFDDSIIATVYMLFAVLCTTGVLIFINQPTRGIPVSLKLSAKLLLQAMPIMLVMFLLFPRIHGGLWGRKSVDSAQTGFSSEISFGSIARLAENTEVAFRVDFNEGLPARDDLYWRGVVLWKFDGLTWRRGGGQRKSPPGLTKTTKPVSYTLTLEPHNSHWLITLDRPFRASFRRAWLFNDHAYYSWRRVSQRIAYTGSSYLQAQTFNETTFPQNGLQLPAGGNPRTRKLAADWAKQSAGPAETVQLALNYFRQQPFTYTLTPGSLTTGTDSKTAAQDLMDRFLFDSRKGFCEHYATSFAYLMRAAGVPARVVVGYQGGQINQYGGYLIVRQSDAHAWCEVWLPNRGWIRVDPTAIVAPVRIHSDAPSALPAGEMNPLWSFFRTGTVGEWLEPMVSVWDLVNARWNRWVMGYSVTQQLDLFSRLGILLHGRRDLAKRLAIFLIAALPLLFIIAFLTARVKKKEEDKIAVSWKHYCQKLADIGLAKPPGQGPRDYMHAILQQRPDLELPVREITERYIALRYDKQRQQEDARQLGLLVKGFVPPKHAVPQNSPILQDKA